MYSSFTLTCFQSLMLKLKNNMKSLANGFQHSPDLLLCSTIMSLNSTFCISFYISLHKWFGKWCEDITVIFGSTVILRNFNFKYAFKNSTLGYEEVISCWLWSDDWQTVDHYQVFWLDKSVMCVLLAVTHLFFSLLSA